MKLRLETLKIKYNQGDFRNRRNTQKDLNGSKPSTFRKVLGKLTVLLIISLPVSTNAACNPGDVFPDCVPKNDVLTLLNKLINAILLLVAVVTVLFIIIGGFQYITSAGNPEQTEKAKKTLLYAVIGLVAVIASYAIVNFIIARL